MNQDVRSVRQFCEAHADLGFFTSAEARWAYITLHSSRFLDAINDIHPVAHAGERVLDIGVRPYLLAQLVKSTYGMEVDGVNDGPDEVFGGVRTFGLNIEKARVPKPDSYYDLILFTEVLEHLTDPSPALVEINRLLKPGGYLYCSTPNGVALGKIAFMLLGRNIADRYCVGSPYGRHNREYTGQELTATLRSFGFRPGPVRHRNLLAESGWDYPWPYFLARVIPSRKARLDVLSQKTGGVSDAHPSVIYKEPHMQYRAPNPHVDPSRLDEGQHRESASR